MRALSIALVLILVAGCSTRNEIILYPKYDSSEQKRRAMMVGTWYGRQETEDGRIRMVISDVFLDGTKTMRFRYLDSQGGAEEKVVYAQWGLSGPIYFSISRAYSDGQRIYDTNPTEASQYNAYKVELLTNDEFH